MADISKLARLINGTTRNVDLETNSLVVLSVKIGTTGANTELTKTILDQLLAISTDLASTANGKGASLVGIEDSAANFAATNVEAALAELVTMVGAGGLVKISAADTTSEYLNASITAGAGLSKSITNPGANEQLDFAVNVDGSSIEISADALRVKALGITSAMLAGTIDATKIGDGSVTSTEFQYINGLTSDAQTQISDKVVKNADITGATKTKITYDAKGLVTAGADATTADIADSTNKRYVTDADLTNLGNLSGTNTGDQIASGVANTPAGNIAATTVQAALNELDSEKVAKAGDSMTGNLAMGANKVTSSFVPNANDVLVNKLYVDGLIAGALWLNPIIDPNLINDSLSTPPGSPAIGDTYIAGATATGAWAAFDGYVFMWNGTSWVDLLGRAVVAGDRFGVSMESATAGAGGLASKDDQIAQVVSPIPGAITYTFTVPVVSNAVYVNNVLSYHTGHQYDYTGSGWVEFGGLNAVSAGTGLSYAANALNVNMGAGIVAVSDEVAVDVHASGGLMTTSDNSTSSTATGAQLAIKLDGSTLAKDASGLKVSTGGISNNEINASAAIVDTKLATISTANKVSGSAVQLATNSGIEDSTGLKIKPDTVSADTIALTLTADGAGVKYDSASFTETSESLKLAAGVAGDGLALTAGVLSVNVDGSTLETDADALRIKDLGVSTAKIAAAAVDKDKIATDVYDGTTISGGAGSPATVAFAPALKINSQVAGESFAATTVHVVRFAMSTDAGYVAGRYYKADNDATTEDKFYAIGVVRPLTLVSAAGTLPTITKAGPFSATSHGFTPGTPIYLGTGGALTATPPSSANTAVVRIGMAKDANTIEIQIQVVGIN